MNFRLYFSICCFLLCLTKTNTAPVTSSGPMSADEKSVTPSDHNQPEIVQTNQTIPSNLSVTSDAKRSVTKSASTREINGTTDTKSSQPESIKPDIRDRTTSQRVVSVTQSGKSMVVTEPTGTQKEASTSFEGTVNAAMNSTVHSESSRSLSTAGTKLASRSSSQSPDDDDTLSSTQQTITTTTSTTVFQQSTEPEKHESTSETSERPTYQTATALEIEVYDHDDMMNKLAILETAVNKIVASLGNQTKNEKVDDEDCADKKEDLQRGTTMGFEIFQENLKEKLGSTVKKYGGDDDNNNGDSWKSSFAKLAAKLDKLEHILMYHQKGTEQGRCNRMSESCFQDRDENYQWEQKRFEKQQLPRSKSHVCKNMVEKLPDLFSRFANDLLQISCTQETISFGFQDF